LRQLRCTPPHRYRETTAIAAWASGAELREERLVERLTNEEAREVGYADVAATNKNDAEKRMVKEADVKQLRSTPYIVQLEIR